MFYPYLKGIGYHFAIINITNYCSVKSVQVAVNKNVNQQKYKIDDNVLLTYKSNIYLQVTRT